MNFPERRAEKCFDWMRDRKEFLEITPESQVASSLTYLNLLICTPRNIFDVIKHEEHQSEYHPLKLLDFLVLDEVNHTSPFCCDIMI